MIISHQHRFIFIKSQKTAGTSIEVFLSDHCGDDDVLTPIDPPHPRHRPRNWGAFFNHMHAVDIRDAIGPAMWDHYYTFCVERNPWDKFLSFYHHLNAVEFGGTLTIDACLDLDRLPLGHYYYTDYRNDGRLIVDRIVRYESLNAELAEVFAHLEIDFPGTLPVRAKGEYRTDAAHYRDVLTPEQAERIRKVFHREIALHGYQW